MSKYVLNLDMIHTELYNAVYNSKKKEEYIGNIVKIDDIEKIDNIKYVLDEEEDEKFLKDNLKNAKFKFVNQYIDNSVISCKINNKTFDIYIYPYYKNLGIDNLKSKNNLSKIFSYYVGQLATLKKANICELHLMNIDICYFKIKEYFPIEVKQKLSFLEDLIQNNEIERVLSIQFVENYFKKKDIDSHIGRKDKKKLKLLICEVLIKLHQLKENLDEIKINNLELNNIILFLKKPSDKKFKINNENYEINNIDFEVRFTDMTDYKLSKDNKTTDSHIFSLVKKFSELIDRSFKLDITEDLFFNDFKNLVISLGGKQIQMGGKKIKKKQKKIKFKEIKRKKNFIKTDILSFKESDDESSENYSIDSDDNTNINIKLHNSIKEYDVKDFKKMVNNENNNSEIALNEFDYPKDMSKTFKEGNIYNELVRKNVDMKIINRVMNSIKNKEKYEIDLKQTKINNQTGGGGRVIPMYDAKRNDPYKTYEDKKVQFDKIQAQNEPKKESSFEPPQQQPMPQRRQNLVHEVSPRGPPQGPSRGPPRGSSRGPSRGPSQNYSIGSEGKNSNGPTININVGDSAPPRPPRPPPRPPPVAEFVAPPIPQVGPYAYPYLNAPMTQPGFMKQPAPIVIKKSMNISNPIGDNEATHNIFEDLLPTSKRKFYFSSMEDREVQYEFFRNILVKEVEGDEVSLGYDKSGILNLSSVMKVLEINPFYSRLLHPNKYASLPENMLFFSACYPIEVNRERQRIDCAKHAMGINLRLYDLTSEQSTFLGQRLGDFNNGWNEHSVWRDVYYYKFMRDNVLLKKKCPNFLLMYSYHVADNYYVDFSGLRSVAQRYSNRLIPKLWKKHRNYILQNYKKMLENDDNFNRLEDGRYFGFLTIDRNASVRYRFDNQELDNVTLEQIEHIQNECRKHRATYYTRLLKRHENILPHERNEMDVELQQFAHGTLTRIHDTDIVLNANKMLCVLTESPTYTIQDWCTRLYRVDDRMYMRVNNMGETGFHRKEVWYTVLFQIMVITKVLFDYNIVISDLSSANNSSLFIKDLNYNDNFAKGYYKYKVGNINYFVENYGSLVVFDPFPRRSQQMRNNPTNCSPLDDIRLQNFRNNFTKIYIYPQVQPPPVQIPLGNIPIFIRQYGAWAPTLTFNFDGRNYIGYDYEHINENDQGSLIYAFANAYQNLLRYYRVNIPSVITEVLKNKVKENTKILREQLFDLAPHVFQGYQNNYIKDYVDQFKNINIFPDKETIALLAYKFGVCIRVWKNRTLDDGNPGIPITDPDIYPRNHNYNGENYKIDLVQLTHTQYSWLKPIIRPHRHRNAILHQHDHVASDPNLDPNIPAGRPKLTTGKSTDGIVHYHDNVGDLISQDGTKTTNIAKHIHTAPIGGPYPPTAKGDVKMAEGNVNLKVNDVTKKSNQKGGAGLIPLIPSNAKPMYPIYKDWEFGGEKERVNPRIISEGIIPDLGLQDHKFASMYSKTLFNDNEWNHNCTAGNKFLDNIRRLVGLEWMNIQFRRLGGVDCPDEIKNFVGKIIAYIEEHRHKVKEGDILKDVLPTELHPENIISKFFRRFMHNKIGSEISERDAPSLLKTPNVFNFKKGDLIAYLDKDGKYKWGLVKENVEDLYEYSEENGVTISSNIKIIKSNKESFNDDEINKYYCKVLADTNRSPLDMMSSREGGPRMIEYYNVDLM